jgi:hypothetical protein
VYEQNEWLASLRWFVMCPSDQQPPKGQERHTKGRDNVKLQVSQVGAET